MNTEPKLLQGVPHVVKDPVEEVVEIVTEATLQEINILKDFNLFRKQSKSGPKADISGILEGTTNKVYEISHLRKLAMIYNMRLLPAHMYTGPVPREITRNLAKFRDTKNHRFAPSRVFIFAPRHMFQFDTVSLSDPIAMYKIDDNHYEYITHWGKDITAGRAVWSFLTAINPLPVKDNGWGMVGVTVVLFILCGLVTALL